MSHFYPERQTDGLTNNYGAQNVQYESEKWRIQSELEGTTGCMNKCNLNMQNAAMSE